MNQKLKRAITVSLAADCIQTRVVLLITFSPYVRSVMEVCVKGLFTKNNVNSLAYAKLI
jgi:hypothetical protein